MYTFTYWSKIFFAILDQYRSTIEEKKTVTVTNAFFFFFSYKAYFFLGEITTVSRSLMFNLFKTSIIPFIKTRKNICLSQNNDKIDDLTNSIKCVSIETKDSFITLNLI